MNSSTTRPIVVGDRVYGVNSPERGTVVTRNARWTRVEWDNGGTTTSATRADQLRLVDDLLDEQTAAAIDAEEITLVPAPEHDEDSGADETTYETIARVAVRDPYGIGNTGWAVGPVDTEDDCEWVFMLEEVIEDFDPRSVRRVVDAETGEPAEQPVKSYSIGLHGADGTEVTVADLIEALDELDPEAVVRFAAQPSYPLQHRLYDGLVVAGQVVYLVDGGQDRDDPYLDVNVAAAAWK